MGKAPGLRYASLPVGGEIPHNGASGFWRGSALGVLIPIRNYVRNNSADIALNFKKNSSKTIRR